MPVSAMHMQEVFHMSPSEFLQKCALALMKHTLNEKDTVVF